MKHIQELAESLAIPYEAAARLFRELNTISLPEGCPVVQEMTEEKVAAV